MSYSGGTSAHFGVGVPTHHPHLSPNFSFVQKRSLPVRPLCTDLKLKAHGCVSGVVGCLPPQGVLAPDGWLSLFTEVSPGFSLKVTVPRLGSDLPVRNT